MVTTILVGVIGIEIFPEQTGWWIGYMILGFISRVGKMLYEAVQIAKKL